MVGPLAYIGGKNRLAVKIISLLPEHTTYVEPFAGGAQVFFHKRPSEVEVLNDLDGEIVNLLRYASCEPMPMPTSSHAREPSLRGDRSPVGWQ